MTTYILVRLSFKVESLIPKGEERTKNSKYRPSRMDILTLGFTPSGDRQTTKLCV